MSERVDQPAELPLLWEVGEDLHRLFVMEERRRALPWPRPRPSLRPRLRSGFAAFNLRLIAALVLLLAAAAVALADGLLSGAPVPAPYKAQPRKDDGAPLGASATLLALSVPDPAGGPPWGMRMLRTTRGDGCLQYGRLYDGQLGVLGQDGAFDDDHRFHALSQEDTVSGSGTCSPLDAHGRLFVSVQSQAVPASAYPQGCIPRVDYGRGARDPGDPGIALCPAGDARALFYGVLGPDVKSITYSLLTHSETVTEVGRRREAQQGRSRQPTLRQTVYALSGPTVTIPTVGPQGAYLIVAKELPAAASDTFGPGAPDGSATLPHGQYQPIRAITYRDGEVCHIGATFDREDRGRPCTPLGLVALAGPSAAQVRAPVSARIIFNHREPPLGRPADVVRISFLARVPVTGAARYYAVAMRLPCRGGSGWSTVDEDVAAGQRLTFYMDMSDGRPGSKPCPGVYSGEVLYGTRSTHLPFLGGGLVVGRFSVSLPCSFIGSPRGSPGASSWSSPRSSARARAV